MTLLDDWKSVLRYAWSIRFIAAGVVVAGAQTALLMGPETWKVGIDGSLGTGAYAAINGVLAAASTLLTVLAGGARVTKQKNLP